MSMRPHRLLLAAVLMAAAAGGQTPPKRQLVEEVRLDANTEDFPDVGSVLVNARGDMVVFVNKDQQLRFYDAAGNKLGTFGRVGSGPGEFRRANLLGWVADTLWLFDFDQRRVTYISPNRQLLRTELLNQSLNSMAGYAPGSAPAARPAPPVEGAIAMFSVRAVTTDRYVGLASVYKGKLPDGRTDSKAVIASIPRWTAVAPENGKLAPAGDTVVSRSFAVIAEPPPTTSTSMQWSRSDGRGSAMSVVPFMFSPATTVSADGKRLAFLTVEPGEGGGTYTLRIMSTAGEPILTRSYPYKGVPIPGSVVDSVMEHFGQQANGRSFFQPEALTSFKDQLKTRMPKFYAPVSRVHLGRDNATWIQMRRPDPRLPAMMVQVDARGEQIGAFDLPPRHTVMYISRDQLWAMVTDEDDLPSVVRYRLK
jgi:hypothetical protein